MLLKSATHTAANCYKLTLGLWRALAVLQSLGRLSHTRRQVFESGVQTEGTKLGPTVADPEFCAPSPEKFEFDLKMVGFIGAF